jgi:hypothetical protein
VDELHQNPVGAFLVGLVQLLKNLLLRIPRERPFNAPNLFISGMGQAALALFLPQLIQGKFQQGQMAGFIAHIRQNALDQSGLKGYVLSLGRLRDGLARFVLHTLEQLGGEALPAKEKRRVLFPKDRKATVRIKRNTFQISD